MFRFIQNNQHLRVSERAIVAIRQITFPFFGILLAGSGIYFLAHGWSMPVKFLCSGEVFIREFKFVDDGDYASGDGFRVAINRMFLFSLMVTAVLLLVLSFWRMTAQPFAGARRIIFMGLSVALSLVPLSAALVGTIMVSRLMMNLGATPKRLLGLAIGPAIISTFPTFYYVTFRKPRTAMAGNPAVDRMAI